MIKRPWPSHTETVIGCRVDDPCLRPVPGATDWHCFNCEHLVRLSPTSLARVRLLGCEVACINCFKAYRLAGEPLILLPDAPDQRRERRA